MFWSFTEPLLGTTIQKTIFFFKILRTLTYPIVKIISPYAYQALASPESNPHPVNKLRLASNGPLLGQNSHPPPPPPPPPPLKASNIPYELGYEVEDILDSRLFGRWKQLKYLI